MEMVTEQGRRRGNAGFLGEQCGQESASNRPLGTFLAPPMSHVMRRFVEKLLIALARRRAAQSNAARVHLRGWLAVLAFCFNDLDKSIFTLKYLGRQVKWGVEPSKGGAHARRDNEEVHS
jgi:hypothetical protein